MILFADVFFIRKSRSEFVITAVYVDDLDINGTHEELPKAVHYLKKPWENKILSLFVDRALSRWNSYSSINLYRSDSTWIEPIHLP